MTEREQLAKSNAMSIEFVNWFFDEKKEGCGNAWFMMMAAMWESWKHLAEQRDQLAAENAAQREYRPQPSGAAMMEALDAFYEYHEDVPEQGMMSAFEILCCKRPQALATDAWKREQQSQAIRAALVECSDYLDTDCVMDRLDISYEDAEKRTSGAMELHDALIAVANRLRNGEAV